MGLRDIGESLPPGFRFYPNDEELVCHYLSKKIANEKILKGTLVEIDLHTCEPWQLPEVAKLNSSEWYFFSFRDRKYATGYRANRATRYGYWKATGKDRTIRDPRTRKVVGMRKTLVFYQNRAPNGVKTGWIMHEFRLENPHVPPKEDWVLCRVFHKTPSKSENNYDILSPQSTLCCATACPTTTSPPADQTFPCCQHKTNNSELPQEQPQQSQNPSNPLNLLDANPNFPDAEVSSKKYEDDEYGFLFDLGLNETCLVNGVSSGYGEMVFDEDSSLVFL